MYDRNPGEIDFGLSQREVQVNEGSSYQESTVTPDKQAVSKPTMAEGWGLNANLNSSLFFVLDSRNLLAEGHCLLVAHCS